MRKHVFELIGTFVLLATIGLTVLAPPVGAQRRPVGRTGITVYTGWDFGGRSETFTEAVTDLERLGLNDNVSSLRVARGERWEVCENANFGGNCRVVSGEVRRLESGAWNNIISSMRPVRSGGVRPPTRPRPPESRDSYIVLFDQRGYRGNPTNFDRATPRLGRYDNRAQSVTIGRGVWELCDGPNFTGHCVTLDRSTDDLGEHGLRGRVSSVRPARPRPRRP